MSTRDRPGFEGSSDRVSLSSRDSVWFRSVVNGMYRNLERGEERGKWY